MYRRRSLLALFLISLFFLLVAAFSSCTHAVLYTPQEIEQHLEQKYGMPFTVQELVSREISESSAPIHRLFYHVTSPEYPNTVFLVKETYIPAHWSEDFFFSFPVYNEASHTLEDNCLTYAWNTFLVPKFEDMGIFGFSAPTTAFDGLRLNANDHSYRMYYHQNAEELVDNIYQIAQELGSVPFFSSLSQTDGTFPDHYYQLFFEIYIDHSSDIVPQEAEDFTWLPITIGYPYTKEEITEQLEESLDKLRARNQTEPA